MTRALFGAIVAFAWGGFAVSADRPTQPQEVGDAGGSGSSARAAGSEQDDTEPAAGFWAFAPPERASLPPVGRAAWLRQRIDAFILARLEAASIEPAPAAARRALIRRVTYDLTGLPPSPDEVAAFLEDGTPDAYERLVDRLLASPRFGERWASLWLDLARYAEDQAHQVGNDEKHFYPNAYRYRDWVTEAFNQDLPYDRFIRLQLAADLAEEKERSEDLVALGFLGLGPKYYNRGSLSVMADEWEDRVDTVSRTFLGLTVACARCHDHKYDPIPTEDFYALAGVFASTKMVNRRMGGEDGDGAAEDGKDGKAKKQPNNRPPPDAIHIVEEGKPRDLPVFRRGDVESKGDVVPRRFLAVLSGDEGHPFARGSGRSDLAEAIADPENPLTGRVLVNRIWKECFGRGLVATASNFGALGERPTHPLLLDDLAVRFAEGGWSIKELLREIVLSATYRQGASAEPEAVRKDPDNRLVGRRSLRRLRVEEWRDSLLSAAGTLAATIGGRSEDPTDPSGRRRTLYSRISRLDLNEFLRLFDYPDPNVHSGGRAVTTTALQKLYVLNSPLVIENARRFARRLARERDDDRARVERAYLLLFARKPSDRELALALGFLDEGATGAAGEGEGEEGEPQELTRWERYAHLLLASNELLFLE